MVARSLSSGVPDGHRALAHCKHHRIDERKKENTMRKVIVSEYVTLDGVMEDPGGAEGFKHGGLGLGFWGGETEQDKFSGPLGLGAALLGPPSSRRVVPARPTTSGPTGRCETHDRVRPY